MAAWDQDDDLLNEMLHDGDDYGEGWDEDLAGLSSDDDDAAALEANDVNAAAAPASGEKHDVGGDDAHNGQDTVLAPLSAATEAAGEADTNLDSEDAWDFDDIEDIIDNEIETTTTSLKVAVQPATEPTVGSQDVSTAIRQNDNIISSGEQKSVPSVVSEGDGSAEENWDFDELFDESSKEELPAASDSANVTAATTNNAPSGGTTPVNPFLAPSKQSNPFMEPLSDHNGLQSASVNTNSLEAPSTEANELQPTSEENIQDNNNEGWSDDEGFFDDDEEIDGLSDSYQQQQPQQHL